MKVELKKYRTIDLISHLLIGTTFLHKNEYYVTTDIEVVNFRAITCIGIGEDNIGKKHHISVNTEVEVVDFKLVEV